MNCDTKYPILLVHGCGFRDVEHVNYWGRIPTILKNEGATLFYGHQDSWGSIENNAAMLRDTLNKILAETNCGKVNVIAHSKGGLEARFLISSLDMADKVASLTTMATPHHGSKTIDLLCKLPSCFFMLASRFVNSFFRILGDKSPDFQTASKQFSTIFMKEFNKQNQDAPSVYYQSYAAVMKNPFSDIFMFWLNLVIGLFEGENDGLLTPKSAEWTNFRGVLRGTTNRGISHMDEVDARRVNFTKKDSEKGIADIRKVYLDIVRGLKQMGL